jgi:GntR family transcriptional repressor for pyruvate dehydrogenase complex
MTADSARPAVRLSPMEVPKAPEVLASQVRERILSERELVIQTQMSRTTVREALRILEAQGLVQIKTGRSGGAFVRKPDEKSVANSLELLIRGRQMRLASIHETREAIEPQCARLAATNRTTEDLAVLDAANEAIAASRTLQEFLQANVDWHIGVATASHNEILTAIMIALSRAIYTATNNAGFVNDEIRAATIRAHRSVTVAIRDATPDAAARRMSGHVHAYAAAALQVEDRVAIPVPGQE